MWSLYIQPAVIRCPGKLSESEKLSKAVKRQCRVSVATDAVTSAPNLHACRHSVNLSEDGHRHPSYNRLRHNGKGNKVRPLYLLWRGASRKMSAVPLCEVKSGCASRGCRTGYATRVLMAPSVTMYSAHESSGSIEFTYSPIRRCSLRGGGAE